MYRYSYITYYELNKKGEKSDILRCAILDDELTFKDSFVYDGFTSDIYKISFNEILARFGSNYYYVSVSKRTLINNFELISINNDGSAVYIKNDKYYTCEISNIANDIVKAEEHSYISSNKYNGNYAYYDLENGTYNNNELIYSEPAQKGIYITKNFIEAFGSLVYSTSGTVVINSAYLLSSAIDSEIYRLTLSNGVKKYLVCKYTPN